MLTFIFVAFGAILVVGLYILARQSGQASGRKDQSGDAVVKKQAENTNPRGSVRSSGSAND